MCESLHDENLVWCKFFGRIYYIRRVIVNFCVKIPTFRLRGNKSRLFKISMMTLNSVTLKTPFGARFLAISDIQDEL